MKWITTIKERIERIVESVKLTVQLFIDWFRSTDNHQEMKIEIATNTLIYTVLDSLAFVAIAFTTGVQITASFALMTIAYTIVLALIASSMYVYGREFRNWFIEQEAKWDAEDKLEEILYQNPDCKALIRLSEELETLNNNGITYGHKIDELKRQINYHQERCDKFQDELMEV